MKIFTYFLTIIIFSIFNLNLSQKIGNKEFFELMADAGSSPIKAQGVKVLFLKIKDQVKKSKSKKRKLNEMANIIRQFLQGIGVVTTVYNWNDEHFVCLMDIHHDLDVKLLLDVFKDTIDNAAFRGTDDFNKKKEEM